MYIHVWSHEYIRCEAGPWVLPQKNMPQEQLEFHAFQLTVSVKGGLSAESQDELARYICKNTLMNYTVIETGANDRRHLHALLIFKEGKQTRKIQNNVWARFVKPYHGDSISRIAVKVQVCPGNKWFDEYLQKEPDREVLSNTWDRVLAEDYFPTPVQQESLIERSKLKGQACPWLSEDITTWSRSTFENTPEGALMYLKHRMFVLRDMIPISDPRKRTEKAYMYWEYRNGTVSPTERELFLLRQLQDGPAYETPRDSSRGAAPSI